MREKEWKLYEEINLYDTCLDTVAFNKRHVIEQIYTRRA